jgi:uncharacterized PurR-regulated membrane protein YhhQ (DUF165 family)
MRPGIRTLAYIASIVIINWLFVVVPLVPVLGTMFPPVMLVAGFVFVLRDFCQREVGHYVLATMLVAGGISYFMSAPEVALASVTAFLISETVDWLVYTVTRRPMSHRILLSSAFSVPIDTFVFLNLVGIFDWTGMALVVLAKMVAAVVLWAMLRSREQRELIFALAR